MINHKLINNQRDQIMLLINNMINMNKKRLMMLDVVRSDLGLLRGIFPGIVSRASLKTQHLHVLVSTLRALTIMGSLLSP